MMELLLGLNQGAKNSVSNCQDYPTNEKRE